MDEITNNNDTLEKQPLVSIIVITYNSSKYVLETLESAKAQTYQNIELIVSDDCSTDNTVEICRKWIEKNKERFVRTELITAEKNTGIPANCNRGVKAAQGEWVKLIAGDDILDKNCIENYIAFVNEDHSIKITFAKFLRFEELNEGKFFYMPKYYGYKHFYSEKNNASKQHRILLRRNFFHGPTIFIQKTLLETIGGFDENYKFEDLPLALNITRRGIKLYFLDKITVWYRTNIPSITNAYSTEKLFSSFYIYKEQFCKDKIYPEASIIIVFFQKMEFKRLKIFDKYGFNRNNPFCRILFSMTYYLNPLNVYNLFF